LLHAFPLSSAMWLAQREALADRYRVLTPDLRGFGGSELGNDPPSIDAMADDVAALLDSSNIDQAVIGGVSLGGYVTMAFCRRHGDRLLGVVLANTRAAADDEEVRDGRLRSAERLEREDSVAVLLEETLPRLIGPSTLRQKALIFGRVRGLVQATPPRAAAWAQRTMAGRPAAFDALRELGVPALVIAGDEDRIATREDAEAMTDVLPNGKLVVIRQSGHLSAVEQPAAFNDAVVTFVNKII
jgi:pimeloyl-ACP methyl ester carboxylesterase